MALTVTELSRNSGPGNRKEVLVTAQFDSSYATGGLSLTPASLGFQTFEHVVPAPASGYVFEYDYTNSKIIAYWCAGSGAAMSQVTATTNLSTVTSRVRIIGT